MSFSEEKIQQIWEKGRIIPGSSSANWRKDICGATMKRTEYGNTQSPYGWEIDHIIPVSKNGTDNLSNLQPMQWENNREKADNYPHWQCAKQS